MVATVTFLAFDDSNDEGIDLVSRIETRHLKAHFLQVARFSTMSRFLLNWDLDSLRVAENGTLEDNESELSDVISFQDSMDLDVDPFGSDAHFASNIGPRSSRFSAQNILPLEVR